MNPIRAKRERGAVLLALLAVVMLAATWMLISQLNAASGSIEAERTTRNSAVLQRAKLALIGYVAAQAVKANEDHPGALPCPEAAGYFDSTTQDGQAAGSCSLPKVGRFPWRTIGTDKLVDASGEPLWYVVSPGWAYTSGTGPVINSNSTGQLTVDGVANDAVALIIAPGPAFTVAASTSPACAATAQSRPTTGNPDWRNYLECENATYPNPDAMFVTTGPRTSFNDQVLKITVADLMPAIEAGIASRIEREIAPLITAVYSGNASWGNLTTLLPMGVAFSIPGTNASAYAGTPAFQGLLPLSYAETSAGSGIACAVTAAPNYCEPNFVKWSGTPTVSISSGITQYPGGPTNCTIATSTTTTVNCTVLGYSVSNTAPSVGLTIAATASNAGAALRSFNTALALGGINAGYTAAATLDSSGAAIVALTGSSPSSNGTSAPDASCGLPVASGFYCYQYVLSVPIFLFADHPNINTLLDSTNATGWFVRNKWHLLSYYAVAADVGPGGAGSCVTGSTCLQVAYHPSNGKQRAVLLLAGSAIAGQNRNSSTLSNWFEGANAGGVSPFELRSSTLVTNRTFNDRIAVLSSN
jgi:hypothetical protein